MVIDVNIFVVLVVTTLFGYFVSCFEQPKRDSWRRLYRLLASLFLSVLLSMLETDVMIGVVAIMAFWGISFSKVLYPNEKEGGKNDTKN